MIRVNLLTSLQDRATVVDGGWRGSAPTAAAMALPVVTLVLAGWWFWSLKGEAAELARELGTAEAALAGLAPAVDAVRGAEARQADLSARVARIEALQRRRGASARLLDRLSRALPDGLWLNEVRQEPAGVVVLGRAGTTATVSDYAAALEESASPGTRIEIVSSRLEQRPGGQETVAFEARMRIPAGDEP